MLKSAQSSAGGMDMSKEHIVAMIAVAAVLASPVSAKGSHGGHSSHSSQSSHSSGGEHAVHGYTTKNGTYVAPHFQTNPNSTRNDNYSTRGNLNPHTGEEGTKPRDGEVTPN